MIKFIHKKHMHGGEGENKFVIYYNVSDIVLGMILMSLVAFFMNDYLSHTVGKYKKMYIQNSMYNNLPPKGQNNISSLKH